jgi:hypothetical protein
MLKIIINERHDEADICLNGEILTSLYNENEVLSGVTIPDDPEEPSTAYIIAESIAVLQKASGEDEVWLSIVRPINSTNHRYIERMKPRVYTDAWFVDCGFEYDGVETDTITGLDHLEGEDIIGTADGVEFLKTVSGGSITLDTAASHVIAGLSNVYKLKPMRFDISVDGTTKGTLKRFAELVVSFLKSQDVQYGIDMDNLFDVPFDDADAENTGDVVLNIDGGFSVEDPIIITGSGPFPCIVRALIPRLEESGR